MANVNLPQGFRPKGKPLRQNTYTSAGAIYAGDLVLAPSGGQVAAMTGGETSVLVLGAAVNSVSAANLPVEIADHPSQLYSVQSSASVASGDIGKYAKVDASVSDSSTFNVSRQQVSGLAASGTGWPLQVMGLDGDIKNSFGANAKLIVKINTHGG